MEHRTRRNQHFYDLISEYEAMNRDGNLTYLDEREFYQIINYYEDEFLVDEALEVVDHATSQHPYCADFLLIKARLLLHKDRPYRAMRYLDKAELIAPFEVDVYILRARAFSEIGEYDQGLALLQEAEKFSTGSDLLDIFLCESSINESMRDFEGMFAALSKALAIDHLSEEALERIWVSVELSKKYEDSIALHEHLIELESFNYQAWFNLGHAYSCIGEYHKAIEAIEYSFIINPDFELGYLDCAEICAQVRDYAKALDIYREMIERFGADSDDLVKMAECEYELGQIEQSKRTLIRAMHLDHYNDEVYYFLGKCFLSQGKVQNAINTFIKAIELEDRREEYYADLAKAYALMDEKGKADFYFRKATEIGPEQEYYWIRHARFLIQADEHEKALEVIEEADYHTFGAELLYCKALCLLHLGFRKKGLKILGEALVENFSLHTIVYELAPDSQGDREIKSMVRYYQGEFVSSL
jgi:tetratricopeptide (TPR) repeat protein